jgi:molybdopterin/thiamine biosynthesis adenylyltransferase
MGSLTAEVRGSTELGAVLDDMLASPQEELLIGLCNPSNLAGWLLIAEECRLARHDEVVRDALGLHWTGALTSDLHDQARRTGRGILLLHAHRGRDTLPQLSTTDATTAGEILPHFGMLLPDVPHAYAVVNTTHSAGWMQLGSERRALDRLKVVSNPLRSWPARVKPSASLPARDTRQAAALGEAGIVALRQSTVAIVGVGGAGSQTAEMLAHAGVGQLILVDGDAVEDVNLSRTHGTSPESLGQSKVASALAMVERISPETLVVPISEPFPSKHLLATLRDVDVLVACVDNVHPRNELNRYALRYGIPLVDVGTTITPEPFRVDGHLSLVMPEGHCLRCAGHVSDILLDEQEAAARRGRYGLGEGRPQVVSFNGLLASAAVTEVLKLIAGFGGAKPGSREWHYDPSSGELRSIQLLPGRCAECGRFGLKGDAA